MQSDPHILLSALIDREPVDPDLLGAVLENPEARALLVDFVRLRSMVLENDTEQPDVTWPAVRRPLWSVPRRTWIGLAAGLLLFLGVGGGLFVGERFGREAPPTPTRVVEFQAGVDWR